MTIKTKAKKIKKILKEFNVKIAKIHQKKLAILKKHTS
jgi:hypothetical protein